MKESSYLPDSLLSDILSEDDRDRIMVRLERAYVDHKFTKEQETCFKAYVRAQAGIPLDDKDENVLRSIGSRLIWHKNIKDYTERELITEFMNQFFDWKTVDLDYTEITTVKYTPLWKAYKKFLSKYKNSYQLSHTNYSTYFKKYLYNYGKITRLRDKNDHQMTVITGLPKLKNNEKAKEISFEKL